MTQSEYDKWRIRKYKRGLRHIRRYFNTDQYDVNWPDAANDISALLARTPEKIEDSIFADCMTG